MSGKKGMKKYPVGVREKIMYNNLRKLKRG